MFDAHNHLHFDAFDDDRDRVLNDARDLGLTGVLLADYDSKTRAEMLRFAERAGVWTTVGIHPWAVAQSTDLDEEVEALRRALDDRGANIVGIGELGLDRMRDRLEEQTQIFRTQLDMARDRDLPIVIHCVKAHEDVLRLLERDGAPDSGGMVHGFSGSAEQALRYCRCGIDISVGTTVTKKNARKVIDAIATVGIDQLMVETDAPSRPPEQVERLRCEPSDLIYVIDAVAQALGLTVEVVAKKTTERVQKRFNLTNEVLQ